MPKVREGVDSGNDGGSIGRHSSDVPTSNIIQQQTQENKRKRESESPEPVEQHRVKRSNVEGTSHDTNEHLSVLEEIRHIRDVMRSTPAEMSTQGHEARPENRETIPRGDTNTPPGISVMESALQRIKLHTENFQANQARGENVMRSTPAEMSTQGHEAQPENRETISGGDTPPHQVADAPRKGYDDISDADAEGESE